MRTWAVVWGNRRFDAKVPAPPLQLTGQGGRVFDPSAPIAMANLINEGHHKGTLHGFQSLTG
jgi:hypothetical protein